MIDWTEKGGFVLVVISLVLVPSAISAEVVLSAGDVSVTLSPGVYWTMIRMSHGGDVFADNPGSGQGTVIREGTSIWAGSIHGNEVILSTDLVVDGQHVQLQDGLSYDGQHIVMERTSTLGETYQLNSRMDIGGGRVAETVTLRRLDSPIDVQNGYFFLATRSNRLTDYAAFDSQGLVLDSGRTTNDDENLPVSYSATTPAVAMAQYDPVAGNGALSVTIAQAEYALLQFICDRFTDNKLYCRFQGIEGILPEGTEFQAMQVITFFEAPASEWLATASALLLEPATPGDTNGNHIVNAYDYDTLVDQFGGSPRNESADFNRDGRVDLVDLGIAQK